MGAGALWKPDFKVRLDLPRPGFRWVLDPLQKPQRVLKVIEGLHGDGLMDGGGHPPVPEVFPERLTGFRGGVGLDLHGDLQGYQAWRKKNERQDAYSTSLTPHLVYSTIAPSWDAYDVVRWRWRARDQQQHGHEQVEVCSPLNRADEAN